jgi:hypothetical protein
MLSIDRSVITDTGSALLNSGDPINITSIKTGSGTYTSTEDIKSRTALKSTQYSYDPTSVQVDGVNRTVSGILTNYDPDTSQAIVTSDYTITEVGLFATVNSVEVLFAIGVSYDGTEVPAFTGQNKSEIIVDWVMALSGTAQVTVSSPGAYATAADLNTHIDNEVFSASGVHGIRAVDDDGVVKIQVYDDGWGDVNGGHVIVDEAGTTYPYRSNLKFYNSTIVDNSADNTTEIHVEGAAIMVTPPTVVVGTYTYNGQPQGPTITWATGMEDYCIVTNATATDAGSYTLTIALKNTNKMFWSDMTTVDKTYSYSIGKATQTITLSSNSVTLDQEHLTSTVTVSDNVGTLSVSSSNTSVAAVSISGDTITIVRQGSYTSSKSATITVTAASTSNYNQQTASISVTANYLAIYGVSWDGTSTTLWTRTDAAASFVDPVPYVAGASSYGSPFDDKMPWSGMKKVTDSAAGTLVEIPKFWYKITQNGAGMKIQIANGAKSGYSVSPAHMDRGDGKGERDKIYVGRYHCATSTYKSTTGVKPANGATRASARASIHNLGSTIWQFDFATRLTLWLLYIVEFADWNCQNKIGYGCGNGSAIENMGYTDSMPYHTGTTKSSRTTYGVGTQYRYIEGLWDNVCDWLDGSYYNNGGLNIILNPASFSDSTGGINVGIPANGYPSALSVKNVSGTYPLFIPTATSGSDSTYTCDKWYVGGSSAPCISGGGSYMQTLEFGWWCILYTFTSSTDSYYGSRLIKLP